MTMDIEDKLFNLNRKRTSKLNNLWFNLPAEECALLLWVLQDELKNNDGVYNRITFNYYNMTHYPYKRAKFTRLMNYLVEHHYLFEKHSNRGNLYRVNFDMIVTICSCTHVKYSTSRRYISRPLKMYNK